MTLAVDIGCSCTAATTASSVLDLSAALSGRESAAARELHAGTPSYISPEQWPGETANAPTDLFAIAVTLYPWLAGRLPNGEIKP